MRVGINGFGRIGRLALRATWERDDLQVVAVNEPEAASRSDRRRGILGFETRPLVSADYARDPRSGVVDALSTRVTDHRLVKVIAWYDNEWGYANRLVELAGFVAAATESVRA